ncbi:alanine aminotransferase 2 [Trichonephila clavipes]|nr:alanine aminotransferase 2 [Trichonephila clavipes]
MDLTPLLNEENINQNLRHMEFPWPSLVVSRGNEIEKEIKMGRKYPFKEVIHAHAGRSPRNGTKTSYFFPAAPQGIGEIKSVKKMRSGDLLVHTTSAIQSKSYLSAKTFLDSPLLITPHKLQSRRHSRT